MPLLVSVIDGGNTITEHWLIDNDVGVERHSEETLVLVPLYQRGLAWDWTRALTMGRRRILCRYVEGFSSYFRNICFH